MMKFRVYVMWSSQSLSMPSWSAIAFALGPRSPGVLAAQDATIASTITPRMKMRNRAPRLRSRERRRDRLIMLRLLPWVVWLLPEGRGEHRLCQSHNSLEHHLLWIWIVRMRAGIAGKLEKWGSTEAAGVDIIARLTHAETCPR